MEWKASPQPFFVSFDFRLFQQYRSLAEAFDFQFDVCLTPPKNGHRYGTLVGEAVFKTIVMKKFGHRPSADAELPPTPLANFATFLVCRDRCPKPCLKNNWSFSNEAFDAPVFPRAQVIQTAKLSSTSIDKKRRNQPAGPETLPPTEKKPANGSGAGRRVTTLQGFDPPPPDQAQRNRAGFLYLIPRFCV